MNTKKNLVIDFAYLVIENRCPLINHYELIATLTIVWTEKWLFVHENLRPKVFMSLKY